MHTGRLHNTKNVKIVLILPMEIKLLNFMGKWLIYKIIWCNCGKFWFKIEFTRKSFIHIQFQCILLGEMTWKSTKKIVMIPNNDFHAKVSLHGKGCVQQHSISNNKFWSWLKRFGSKWKGNWDFSGDKKPLLAKKTLIKQNYTNNRNFP